VAGKRVMRAAGRPLSWGAVSALTRMTLGLLLLLYLFVIAVSHSTPLSSALEAPLAFVGGFSVALLALSHWLRTRSGRSRRPELSARKKVWSRVATLAFAAVAGLALYLALTGNVPTNCPQGATSCVKIDEWRISGGHYYRLFPYDSQGNDDPSRPWVEIDRQTYVAEVGTRLRMAAAFGVAGLCLAWLLAGGLISPRPRPTSRRRGRRGRSAGGAADLGASSTESAG
jgi:hypothetical protein